MDEDPTTPVEPTAPVAPDEGQPTEPSTPPEPGETPDTNPSEPSEGDNQPAAVPGEPSEADEALRKFADSQGIDLDSPGAIKAAQIALKARGDRTRDYRKSTELEKSAVTTTDEYAEQYGDETGEQGEYLKRLNRLEAKSAIQEFYSRRPEAAEYDDAMGKIAKNRPHLLADLDALYATAVVEGGKLESAKSQGKREALKSLASVQQAAVPTGHATQSGAGPKEKPFTDLSINEMEQKLGFFKY